MPQKLERRGFNAAVGEVLWMPSDERQRASMMWQFMMHVNAHHGLNMHDYNALYAWSIASLSDFWQSFALFAKISWDTVPTRILEPAQPMWDARFFPDGQLNYARHCLMRRDHCPAVMHYDETGHVRTLSFDALYQEVAACQRLLRESGVQRGDVVAGVLPNIPEAIIVMLATTAMGAIWSSCSPEFGVSALMDRLAQICPKVFFYVKTYRFKGQTIDVADNMARCLAGLPSVQHAWSLDEGDTFHPQDQPVVFEVVPFNHPLCILYSSGTTGKPKCIVHGHGGTLLQHMKELSLHTDLQKDERLLYVTTCGWMMWNWMVSGLSVGACIVLYEGSPLYPTAMHLWEIVSQADVHVLGVGAKYLSILEKQEVMPCNRVPLPSLHTLLSTGSPLMPGSFAYVYEAVKSDICLSSISGGTDIISCFVLGCPLLPVRCGEIQCRGLGMAVEVWDAQGHAVCDEQGELVCVKSFPSQPIGFWNDANKQKYRETYFKKFPNVWTHGDYAMLTGNGSIVIFGRSDATLNPGGIRIGTAEIYNVVERFDAIQEALAIGRKTEGDERVLLYVLLKPGRLLTPVLVDSLKQALHDDASPRHVPHAIIAVPDFPRTVNGKLSEMAVAQVVNGLPVQNEDALLNPEALRYFRETGKEGCDG